MKKTRGLSKEQSGLVAAALSMAAATIVLAGLALSPGPDTKIAALVFAPGMSQSASFRATLELGGRPLSTWGQGRVVFADFDSLPHLPDLWKHGAVLAVDPILKSGCGPQAGRKTPLERKT